MSHRIATTKRRLAWLIKEAFKSQSGQVTKASAIKSIGCTEEELELAAAKIERAGGATRLPEGTDHWSILEPTRNSFEVWGDLHTTDSIAAELLELLEREGLQSQKQLFQALADLDPQDITKALELLKSKGQISTNQSKSRIRLQEISSKRAVEQNHFSIEADPGTLSQATTITAGAMIDGYRLIAPIGKGGSADVWRAEVFRKMPGVKLETGTEVAMKFYRTEILAQVGEHIRIQREFLVANKINHENVVRVFDLVVSPNRNSFLVMEFVDGDVLSRIVPEKGLAFPHVVGYGIQLARAADAVHRMGALHRDIKPSNVIVKEGVLKLLDLGIVAVEDGHDATAPSYFLGSKHYASFEQLVREPERPIDHRSDVYSIGASLFHLYSGRQPYIGRNPNLIAVRMERGDYDLLTAKAGASRLESEFVQYVNNQLMAKEPAERPSNAKTVLSALEALQGELETTPLH